MDLPSLSLCILLEILAVGCEELIQGRIVGGYSPAPHSIKYIVSIQTTRGQHFCGGSLVNKYWVLTAAHCNIGMFFFDRVVILSDKVGHKAVTALQPAMKKPVDMRRPQLDIGVPADKMMIVAGDYSLSMYEGTEQFFIPHLLIPHPQHNSTTNNNDIMLIKLKAPVFLNGYVAIAPLPRQGASIAEGRVCRVSGWGFTSSSGGQIPSSLRTVKLPIVSIEKCNSSDSFNGNITVNMLCAGYSAGGKDACKGDSGGPLVCEGRVYGLVSWGRGCADAQYPGVYTAVSKFRRWIDHTIFSFYSRCTKY